VAELEATSQGIRIALPITAAAINSTADVSISLDVEMPTTIESIVSPSHQIDIVKNDNDPFRSLVNVAKSRGSPKEFEVRFEFSIETRKC